MSKFKRKDYSHLPHYMAVNDAKSPSKINLVSVVADPAIKSKGKLFKDDLVKEFTFAIVQDEQRIIAPVLIPDVEIYRNDEDGEYIMTFSKEVIKQLYDDFKKSGDNRRLNMNHSSQMINGFINSDWIVEDTYYDKTRMYGINVPVGTVMFDVKIEDSEQWALIKEQGMSGFSIEATLGIRPANLSKQLTDDEIIDSLSDEDIFKLERECTQFKVLEIISDSNFGYTRDQIELIDDDVKEFAKDRKVNGGIFYYYMGPIVENSRDFCRAIIKLDKVFSQENIEALSDAAGYDVSHYTPGEIMKTGGPGGPNCPHKWVRFRGKVINTNPVTNGQINSIGNKSIFR